MRETDRSFTGDIAEAYERILVPMFFEPYALDMAHRLETLAPASLLETACGTGAVTRAVRARLPGTPIVATDLNPGMLDQARKLGLDDGVTFAQADALQLPFADGAFGAVYTQFGVMFFPDKVAAFREARRVLAPGGAYVFNVWDRLEHNALSRETAMAIGPFAPEGSGFLQRVPFGYYDIGLIREHLLAAGFTSLSYDDVVKNSVAPSARVAALGLCQGTPLRADIAALAEPEAAFGAVVDALETHFGMGVLSAPMRALVITARR